MEQTSVSFGSMLKKLSAWTPVAMSLSALFLVLAHVALFGAAREADEGATAHLWQLLMAGQLPFIAYFAITWYRRVPRQALVVMTLQAGAALAALAPVFFWKL